MYGGDHLGTLSVMSASSLSFSVYSGMRHKKTYAVGLQGGEVPEGFLFVFNKPSMKNHCVLIHSSRRERDMHCVHGGAETQLYRSQGVSHKALRLTLNY